MSLVFLLPGSKVAPVHWVRIDLGMGLDFGHLRPSQRIDRRSKVGPVAVVCGSSEGPCLEQVFFETYSGGCS